MNATTEDLDRAAERYQTCLKAYDDAKRELRDVITAISPGTITDYEIRKRTGLSMNTIRAWLGKTSSGRSVVTNGLTNGPDDGKFRPTSN